MPQGVRVQVPLSPLADGSSEVFLPNYAKLHTMKRENGKIAIIFILIILVILAVLLFALAPQNTKVTDPLFIVQYWQNITRALSNLGVFLSRLLQPLGESIANFFSNIGLPKVK